MMSIVIGSAVVLAAGILGRRLGGPVVGLVAAGFAAINPNLWQPACSIHHLFLSVRVRARSLGRLFGSRCLPEVDM